MIKSWGYLLRPYALEMAKNDKSTIIDIKLARQGTSNDPRKKKPIARPNSSSQTDTQTSRWWRLNQWRLGYHHVHQRSNHATSREIPFSGSTPPWLLRLLSPSGSKLDELNSEQPAVRITLSQAKTLSFQLCLLNLSGVSGVSKRKQRDKLAIQIRLHWPHLYHKYSKLIFPTIHYLRQPCLWSRQEQPSPLHHISEMENTTAADGGTIWPQ